MKLDIDAFDEYDSDMRALCRRAQIFLNGQPAERVLVADEEQGYIIRHKLDDQGRLVVENDEPQTEKICGDVKIIDPELPQTGHQA